MSLVFALGASPRELPSVEQQVEVQQRSHVGTRSLVSGLGTEVSASGSAQFEIQGGRKETEMDLVLLMRILKVA